MNKRELRMRMKRIRAAVTDREKKDEDICRAVTELPEFQQAKTILFYWAVGSEPSLKAAMEAAQRQGKRVLLPRCINENEMIAAEFTEEKDLKVGRFGISEPTGEVEFASGIDLVLCPGLAFDRSGGRLGYGGGYYDRFLQKLEAFRVGICYRECIAEHVPMDERDLFMQTLICEKGIIRIKEEK